MSDTVWTCLNFWTANRDCQWRNSLLAGTQTSGDQRRRPAKQSSTLYPACMKAQELAKDTQTV